MLWRWKHILAVLCVLTLMLPAVLLPASAVSSGAAEVRISAEEMDTPQESLHLLRFQRNQRGVFELGEPLDFITPVNRVTEDVEFHLTPRTQQVSLTVDYLTDLDGDGVYELLQDGENPVNDVLTASGSLAAASSGISTVLTPNRTYTLTAEMLLGRAAAVLKDRTTSGSSSFLSGISVSNAEPSTVLYMITVSCPEDYAEEPLELCYYLRLFEELPAPSAGDYRDVDRDAWYYEAVDYVVSQGLLSGTSRSQFSPEQSTTRAMLAQTLHQLAGKPDSGLSHYADVPDTAWCYSAVSWVSEQGIMSGSGDSFAPERALSRQELAVALYRFVQEMNLNVRTRETLEAFADAEQVSSWARASVEWAVSIGLLAGREHGGEIWLAPSDTVTRAEFAAVLQTLCETVLSQAEN